jgi:Flp pilus assembly protein TadD
LAWQSCQSWSILFNLVNHLSYQILPNIIFIFAILGIVLIILRHLPEAATLEAEGPESEGLEERLALKGLPAIAISKVRSFLKWWGKKLWNFILEAKDLKPSAVTGYKIKKIFGDKPTLPSFQPTPKNENEEQPAATEETILEKIKDEPKNLSNYDVLGKFYLESNNFGDAKDIYLYLTKHEPGNSDFQARLAYIFYKQGEFSEAADRYNKSLTLDSSQPNRYYNLGLSREAEGKIEEAVKAFVHAIALEGNNPKFHIGLSNAYLKTGDKNKALQALSRAKKLDPTNQSIQTKILQLMQ